MRNSVIISLLLICSCQSAHAGRYYNRDYDRVDAIADQEIAAIDAQERAQVMEELREGDYRQAQAIMQYDEAVKSEIRREKAMYDAAKCRNKYGNGFFRW
ncbi:MAG: hypothetical protein ABL925_14580 [Methylococcales bacterium]